MPAGKNARQQVGQTMLLRDGQCARRAPLIQPVTPRSATCRALDAEENAPFRAGWYGQKDTHAGANRPKAGRAYANMRAVRASKKLICSASQNLRAPSALLSRDEISRTDDAPP